jgi:hypothetical protein
MRLTPKLQVLTEQAPRTIGAGTRLHWGRLLAPLGGNGAKSVPVSRRDNLARRRNVPRPKDDLQRTRRLSTLGSL